MTKIIIDGGKPLYGEISVCGSKNSCLPILAAAILCDEPVILNNCPKISDVNNMLSILEHTGATVNRRGNTVELNCKDVFNHEMPRQFSREIRSSIFMLGPVVSRFKKARFIYPGGCEIGLRPIDLHLQGLKALNIGITEERGEIFCETNKIIGADISLDYPSVGATENVIMASVLAEGETIIRNAAREPEIFELTRFLNACGADVRGEGSSTIYVKGVQKLHGVEFDCVSDRIVSGTYMLLCAMCKGALTIKNAQVSSLHSLIYKLKDAGVSVKTYEDDTVEIASKKRLKELHLIETAPYPGFPTDLQAPICAACATAQGTSIVMENVFENRFKHVSELNRMGANITVKNNVAIIRGVKNLFGAQVRATDLRAGAAMVIAGLSAQGRTVIDNAQYIERGYEDLVETIQSLNGEIYKQE